MALTRSNAGWRGMRNHEGNPRGKLKDCCDMREGRVRGNTAKSREGMNDCWDTCGL